MWLTLVRHAQSEANVAESLGFADTPLTQLGREQAMYAAERLRAEQFDVVLVSPYIRAQQTAEPILAALGMKPILEPRAQEHNFGVFCGKPYPAFRERAMLHEGDWRAYVPEEGESIFQLRERILTLVHELRVQHSGRQVLLVTHGGTIVNLLLALFGDDLEQLPRYRQWNTGISRLEFSDTGAPTIHFLNDLSHIPEEIRTR